MNHNLDRFVEQLQEQIFEETRETFGEKVYRRWREPLYMHAMNHADGCSTSVVCGSYAAEMAFGKSADELMEIDGNMILETLGGLPEENEHCAHLAAESLHAALDDYLGKGIDT